MKLELIFPSLEFKKSFLEALKEYHSEGRYLEKKIDELDANFEAFTQQVKDYSEGRNLPEGYVRETKYWLVDKDSVLFIGNVSIRHELNGSLLKIGGNIGYDVRPSQRRKGYGKKILEMVLPKAKEFGLTRALVTCDETNIGSAKIIEANGGVLENIISQGEGLPRKKRYWIQL